ncbi:MAG: YicC/YloC family endoribonuclease [Oscillospiraceae bacterium]|nr:YicC/YloC family endoribonuclease [Oscillospiraceae bacterium]
MLNGWNGAMIKSMTGFGRASEVVNGREITVELRSVNHRYFEYSSRVPRAYSFLEDKIKAHIQKNVSRGKFDCGVTIFSGGEESPEVELDLNVAKSYAAALDTLSRELGVSNDATAVALARFPDVFNVRRAVPDEEQLWSDVCTVLDAALASYNAMRVAEGGRLCDDVCGRLDFIENAVGEIEKQSAPRLERYREKLLARMRTVLESTEIDENRILLEAALYADKAAIDEETVRLRSHIEQYRGILRLDEPVGRKLDFLTQEVNREINTIGSKANDLDITQLVVDVKAEIEKIREQIQNIE